MNTGDSVKAIHPDENLGEQPLGEEPVYGQEPCPVTGKGKVRRTGKTSTWLAELFRKKELLVPVAMILDYLDGWGYLLCWGWARRAGCGGFKRSARESAIRVLLVAGIVDRREVFLGKKIRDVFVRSNRYSDRLAEILGARNLEMMRYRKKFSWWLPSGPLDIPNPKTRARRAKKFNGYDFEGSVGRIRKDSPRVVSAELLTSTRKSMSAPIEIADSKSTIWGKPQYPTQKATETQRKEFAGVFEDLAQLMHVSVQEARMYGAELAEGFRKARRCDITVEEAAEIYLKQRNWDFKSWSLLGE